MFRTRPIEGCICAIVLALSSMVRPVSAQDAEPREQARNWTRTLGGTLQLLTFEHAIRIGAQEKTRRELGGPFWSDYAHSLHWPRQWSDGDGWRVNNVGHPVHGAAAARIWLEHDPSSQSLTFD